ncbi:MAG TPA: CBS domain-containing protein [Gaiellaceae bacterium]|nr:CBS domain-containing protein [Gaiellaceae bacterium]
MASVETIMTRDLLRVDAGSTLVDAARRMDERRVGAALVFDGERLTGILTERDVLRAVARGAVATATVAEWMTHHPETIESTDTTGHAAAMMIHGGFRHLPVAEGDAVVGIVSIRDLMRVVLDDEAPRGA